jgi:pilus assembly protein CpaD
MMMRRFTVLALIVAGTSLSACGTSNRGVSSVHQPVVARTDYVFDLPAPGGDRLSSDDAARLSGWFDSVKLRYGDRVSIDAPGDYGYARPAIATVVARYGLLLDDQAPVTQGAIAPGAIRIVISRMTASVPSCPDWSRPASPNFGGDAISNYGCATNTNLASMVADPQDLIRGRESDGSADAASATKAIKTYRAAPPTGSQGLRAPSTRGN